VTPPRVAASAASKGGRRATTTKIGEPRISSLPVEQRAEAMEAAPQERGIQAATFIEEPGPKP